ncbi:MAG: hypothetical protein ABIW31_06505 [Novosphingobium sp.]
MNDRSGNLEGLVYSGKTVVLTGASSGAFFDNYGYPLLGRMASAAEQAWPLVLLNSPLNLSVTGTVLVTDQGNLGRRDPSARRIDAAVTGKVADGSSARSGPSS